MVAFVEMLVASVMLLPSVPPIFAVRTIVFCNRIRERLYAGIAGAAVGAIDQADQCLRDLGQIVVR